jgi:hypothetical protein
MVREYTQITYEEFREIYKNVSPVFYCDCCHDWLNKESYYIKQYNTIGAWGFCSETCFNIRVLQVTFR